MALSTARSLCRANILNPSKILRLYAVNNNIRQVSIKIIPNPAETTESYEERNARLNRTMSPHLSIYKPQLTSMLSISHRITGMALFGYATILGLGSLVMPHDFSHYITMLEGLQMGAATIFSLKFILAFPTAYHVCNGVRHLLWDNGKFLKLREVYSTGYIMLGAASAVTILLTLL